MNIRTQQYLVRKIVNFCKHIPQWNDIEVPLQLKLIKGGLTEALVLYNTCDYDPERQLVKFMDGKYRSKEAFYAAGFNPDIVNSKISIQHWPANIRSAIFSIWEYCHKNNVADPTSVALLTAACLTSTERCVIRDEKLEKEPIYINFLQRKKIIPV